MSGGPDRVAMLDAMRLAAAIGVIFIHVSFVAHSSPDMGEFLRFLMRWAVPFFFLLTGYFLKQGEGFPTVSVDRLRRIVIISLVANLVYLPLLLVTDGVRALDLSTITSGTWFHLWFLSSLVFGMLTLLLPPKTGLTPRHITIMSIGFIILAHAFDILSSFDEGYLPLARLCRFVIAGPLIWLGFILASLHKRPKPSVSLALVMFGIMVCIAETVLYSKIEMSIFSRQYSLGSMAVAIGIVLWARDTRRRPLDALVRIGRDYSLVIYVIHPIFLKVTAVLIGQLCGSCPGAWCSWLVAKPLASAPSNVL